MIKQLILVRHGQTDHNQMIAGKKITGKKSLNKVGDRQAKAVGKLIKDLGFTIDFAFSSQLERARDMASLALAGSGVPIQALPQLNERSLGDLEDVPWQEYQDDPKYADDRAAKKADWLGYRPPGGNTLHEVQGELQVAWHESNKKAPEGCVAWFTHAQTMVAAMSMSQLFGFTSAQLMRSQHRLWPNPRWVQNGQMIIIRCDDPQTGILYPHMRFYRVIAPFDKPFDTEWQRIKR